MGRRHAPVVHTTSDLPAGRARLLAASPAGRLYTPGAVSMRRTYLILLAILVTLFVALYPYLGAMKMCYSDECPYAAQTSTQSSVGSAGFAGLCLLGVVLAVSSVGILAFAMLRGTRLDEGSRPARFFLSPDPPPPQFC